MTGFWDVNAPTEEKGLFAGGEVSPRCQSYGNSSAFLFMAFESLTDIYLAIGDIDAYMNT